MKSMILGYPPYGKPFDTDLSLTDLFFWFFLSDHPGFFFCRFLSFIRVVLRLVKLDFPFSDLKRRRHASSERNRGHTACVFEESCREVHGRVMRFWLRATREPEWIYDPFLPKNTEHSIRSDIEFWVCEIYTDFLRGILSTIARRNKIKLQSRNWPLGIRISGFALDWQGEKVANQRIKFA